MEARRGNKSCTRWWVVVVVLVVLSPRLPGLHAWYCSAGDRETLLEFRSAFVDVGGVFSTWNPNSNCCTWRGVRCAERDGAVLELTLVGNSQSGSLQSYRDPRFVGVGAGLVALASLQQLTIQWLILDQPVPSEWGEFSSNLQIIVINNANLYGNIPSSLAYIPNLQTLDLRSNHLMGVIPLEFCKQRSIRYIDVSFNDLNNMPVPRCLNRIVIVVYNNQGQNTSPGPPGWSNNPGGPAWSMASDVSSPLIAFKAISIVVLFWTLL